MLAKIDAFNKIKISAYKMKFLEKKAYYIDIDALEHGDLCLKLYKCNEYKEFWYVFHFKKQNFYRVHYKDLKNI